VHDVVVAGICSFSAGSAYLQVDTKINGVVYSDELQCCNLCIRFNSNIIPS
jgi:hypothetical protein